MTISSILRKSCAGKFVGISVEFVCSNSEMEARPMLLSMLVYIAVASAEKRRALGGMSMFFRSSMTSLEFFR